VPRLFTGGRASYGFGDVVRLTALVTNGWLPNIVDNNAGKTYGLSLRLDPAAAVSLTAHYLTGAERATEPGWRHTVDAVLTLRVPMMVLTVEGVLGREPTRNSPTKAWQGGLASARFDPSEWFSLGVRGEYFDNVDGVDDLLSRLGTSVWEVTVTPAFKFGDTMLRLEYRYDHAGRALFQRATGPAEAQQTLAANWLFAF
jgi:hypothetical protein